MTAGAEDFEPATTRRESKIAMARELIRSEWALNGALSIVETE